MDQKGESQEGAVGLKNEELPQMDGSCDACEPDEAQTATHVCHTCSFAFCPVHAERHANSTRHPLIPYRHEEMQANGPGTSVDAGVAGFKSDSETEGNSEMAAGDAGAKGGKTGPQLGAEVAERVEGAEAAAEVVEVAERVEGAEAAEVAEVAEVAERVEGAEAAVVAEVAERVEGAEAAVVAEVAERAKGAKVGQQAMAAGDAGKRDTVTVERLRCKEHGQEGSLYCKPDEKIICVVCAVQGDHREHEIITLHEAYTWQKSRQGHDLLSCTQQMADKIKTKWTNPEMSTEELEDYVNSQFDELRRLVRIEEKRTLHLVDLKEAFLTASAAEKIAEISVETERLQEEMANINNQLYLLEQAEAGGAAVIAKALVAAPGPAHRMQHNIEARPRLPEPRANPLDRLDFEDNDFEPSMDHAP